MKDANGPLFHRERLAPIAGSIEEKESPIQAAWRELEEETTLTPHDVQVWRQGRPYKFDDPTIGRQWIIHPFAFFILPGRETKIKIDWEHEGWEWYDPNEITDDEKFNGVPHLTSSLNRVYFEKGMNSAASGALKSSLEELKNDHQSGSHELTTIAVKAFRDVLVHLQNDRDWWDTAQTAAWHIWKNGRESMGAATLNAFLSILADIESILPQTLEHEPSWDRVLAVVDYHLEERREIPVRIKESFTKYLAKNFIPIGNGDTQTRDTLTVLTLSASSTIRDTIIETFSSLPFSTLDLRILESRPLFEGASMASALLSSFESNHPASCGRYLKLSIYTDASAAIAAGGVDFVLLGADRISASGCVSNKTGSLPAVLSAKYVNPDVKVLVLSGLDKVAGPEDGENDHGNEQEYNDSVEITASWVGSCVRGVNMLEEGIRGSLPKTANCRVNVRNVYFEWVPSELIDGYLCEKGVCSVSDIQQKALQVKKETERYFGVKSYN